MNAEIAYPAAPSVLPPPPREVPAVPEPPISAAPKGAVVTPAAGSASEEMPPAADGGRGSDHRERDRRALAWLELAYPAGSQVRFRGYDPVLAPLGWRRQAAQAAWGLKRGDLLEVTAYGVARNFPEALVTRRLRDGVPAMIFPAEAEPAARLGDTGEAEPARAPVRAPRS
jgi:hypothetical protein